MQVIIGEIAEKAICINPSSKCREVFTIFKENTSVEGVVVSFNDIPIGLVTKTQFYQKLSTQ